MKEMRKLRRRPFGILLSVLLTGLFCGSLTAGAASSGGGVPGDTLPSNKALIERGFSFNGDNLFSLIPEADGGYVGLVSSDEWHEFLVRYGANGGVIQEETPLPKELESRIMLQTSGGFFFVYGNMISKTDTQGNIVFSTSYKGADVQVVNDAAGTEDGGIVAVYDCKKAPTIAKFDMEGELTWSEVMGAQVKSLRNVIQLADGGYLAVADLWNGGMEFRSFDKSGKAGASIPCDGSQVGQIQAVCALRDGGFVTAGLLDGHSVVMRFSSGGSVIWRDDGNYAPTGGEITEYRVASLYQNEDGTISAMVWISLNKLCLCQYTLDAQSGTLVEATDNTKDVAVSCDRSALPWFRTIQSVKNTVRTDGALYDAAQKALSDKNCQIIRTNEISLLDQTGTVIAVNKSRLTVKIKIPQEASEYKSQLKVFGTDRFGQTFVDLHAAVDGEYLKFFVDYGEFSDFIIARGITANQSAARPQGKNFLAGAYIIAGTVMLCWAVLGAIFLIYRRTQKKGE